MQVHGGMQMLVHIFFTAVIYDRKLFTKPAISYNENKFYWICPKFPMKMVVEMKMQIIARASNQYYKTFFFATNCSYTPESDFVLVSAFL